MSNCIAAASAMRRLPLAVSPTKNNFVRTAMRTASVSVPIWGAEQSASRPSMTSFDSPAHYFAVAEEARTQPLEVRARPDGEASASTPMMMSFDSPAHYFSLAEEARTQPREGASWWTRLFASSAPVANDEAGQESRPLDGFADVIDATPLPRSLSDVPADPRAVVVTEATAPFRVAAVNEAWVGLCGHTQAQARGSSIGSLLSGPETDQDALRHMLEDLMSGEESKAEVVNYDASGRKFMNRLRVGRIRNDTDEVTHFVAVLREVAGKESRSIEV